MIISSRRRQYPYDDNHKLIFYAITEGSVPGYTAQDKGNGFFINTIDQQTLNFTGSKVWNMDAKTDADVLKPEAQPVTVALYYVNADGTLGQRVTMSGNPVEVAPVTADNGAISNTFSFQDLPRYNLSSGEELKYTVREVSVTTGSDGTKGYTPVADNGTITLTVSKDGTTFPYQYAVSYTTEDTSTAEGKYTGSDTTVTNTYSDPDVYFYQIICNYYTYQSGTPIRTETGVNCTGTATGYATAATAQTIHAVVDDYATYNGLAFTSDSANVTSVDLEKNHMCTITLNYVRNLYTLTVNYTFEDSRDKPAEGFENATLPSWAPPAEGEVYADPGSFLSRDTYTGTYKSAPDGFRITQVTVKNSEAAATPVDSNYNGGQFYDHDVVVTYVYARVINPDVTVTDPSFTIQKVDSTDNTKLLTHDAAEFTLYSDATFQTPAGKTFTTVSGLKSISASQLGVGTWYLKETTAPAGYALADTVWTLTVGYGENQVLEGTQWVNHETWTLSVTDSTGANALAANVLTVPNAREYGYLTITKTVTGLQMNESKTFQFTVTGQNYGGAPYSQTYSIDVVGNATSATKAIRIPTGSYVVTEIPGSTALNGYDAVTPVYSTENGTVTVDQASTEALPANITVTNAYHYSTPSNVTITGEKLWADDNNRDGLRPASIRVQLLVGGEALDVFADVPASGTQSFQLTYDGYLNTSAATVQEVGYTDLQGTYHEGALPGYEVSGEGNQANHFAITNTHTPETMVIQANKVWISGNRQDVTLNLLANGTALDASLTLNGSETTPWSGAFTGTFYKYDNGALIDYTVTENTLGANWSYTTTENSDQTSFTVANTYTNPTPPPPVIEEGYDDPTPPSPPVVDIPNEDVPTTDLLEIPEEPVGEEIADEDVPLADVPETGDSLTQWILAAAVSGVGLVWVALIGKKRKPEDR